VGVENDGGRVMTCHKCHDAVTECHKSAPLFDNPLQREFLTLEAVASFLDHTPEWVIHKVNEGILPCYQVGKTQRFFHVEDIRNAILQNSLALQGGAYDQKDEKKGRPTHIRGKGQKERSHSLQELRERKRCNSLGE
jgi:hypothetical protein